MVSNRQRLTMQRKAREKKKALQKLGKFGGVDGSGKLGTSEQQSSARVLLARREAERITKIAKRSGARGLSRQEQVAFQRRFQPGVFGTPQELAQGKAIPSQRTALTQQANQREQFLQQLRQARVEQPTTRVPVDTRSNFNVRNEVRTIVNQIKSLPGDVQRNVLEFYNDFDGKLRDELIQQGRGFVVANQIASEVLKKVTGGGILPTQEQLDRQRQTAGGQFGFLKIREDSLGQKVARGIRDVPLVGAKAELQFAQEQPVTALVTAGLGEVVGRGLGDLGSSSRRFIARRSTFFRPVEEEAGSRFIRGLEIAGEPRQIEIIGGVETSKIPLPAQAKQAGRIAEPVSAQRDLFGTFFNREIKINKPLPKPGASQLETSFFADPVGRLRTTRLGLQQNRRATFSELLSGDLGVSRQKPQAIIFPRSRVEQFPKNLQKIRTKLITGKPLTRLERQELLEFQLTPSGQFKPVGFVGEEAEITLPKPEIIARKRLAGKTIIDGEVVPIIEAEIKTSNPELKQLINSYESRLIEPEEFISRYKTLSGIDLSSSLSEIRPYLTGTGVLTRGSVLLGGSIRDLGISVTPRSGLSRSFLTPSRSISPITSPIRRGSSRLPRIFSRSTTFTSSATPRSPGSPSLIRIPSSPVSPPPSSPVASGSPFASSILSGSPSTVTTPGSPPPTTGSVLLRSALRKVSRGAKVTGYNTLVKRKGKFRKVGKPKPYSLAVKRGVDVTGKSLAATFKVKRSTKKVSPVNLSFTPNPRVYRNYKVVRGRRVALKDTWIEKRGFRLDTRSEVISLQKSRKRKPRKKNKKRMRGLVLR